MRTKALTLITSLCLSCPLLAQRQQQVDIEILGSTNLVGVHFEQPLGKTSPFAVRGGLSYGYAQDSGLAIALNEDYWALNGYDRKEHQIAVPMEVNFLTGLTKMNHLEAGLGTSLGYYHSSYEIDNVKHPLNSFGYFCFAKLGWRHDFKKRSTLRLGATATFDFGGEKAVKRKSWLAPYVSFGFRL